jgi:hypothetical protein
MYAVTAKFKKAITQPHKIVSRATLVATDGRRIEVPIEEGTVHQDRTAEVRTQADLVLLAADLPQYWRDALRKPYAMRVLVSSGLEYADGAQETVPLGWLYISDVSWGKHQDVFEVKAQDVVRLVSDAKFPVSHPTFSGTTIAALNGLVKEPWGDSWYGMGAGPNPMNVGIAPQPPYVQGGANDKAVTWPADTGDERWAFMVSLATAIGAEMYAAYDSAALILAKRVDPYNPGAPVWAVAAGESGVLIDFTGNQTRDGVYNAVIVTGSVPEGGSGTGPYGYIEDNRATSDTYPRYYGRRTLAIQSDSLTTAAACLDSAWQAINANLGVIKVLSVTTVPHPALRVGDPITIDVGRGVEPYLIDTLEIPLGPSGTFTISARTTTLPPAIPHP